MNGLNLLQQYIKEQELTGVILMSPINLHYFAGFTGTTGFAIITPVSYTHLDVYKRQGLQSIALYVYQS